MAKQTATDRLKRFSRGFCPVHGLFMSQIDSWHMGKDGRSYTIVGCSRQSCMIIAKAYSYDGPWELPEKLLPLLNDSLPDPVFTDETVKPKNKKRNLKNLKNQVLSKTSGKCYYCGESIGMLQATIDHIMPESNGGTHDLSNLVPACKSCNSSKGTKSIEEFRFLIQMKLFSKMNGVSFSQEQVNYLNRIGVNIAVPRYEFWFEANSSS